MQVTELRTVTSLILQQSKYKYSYAFVIYSVEIGKNEKNQKQTNYLFLVEHIVVVQLQLAMKTSTAAHSLPASPTTGKRIKKRREKTHGLRQKQFNKITK